MWQRQTSCRRKNRILRPVYSRPGRKGISIGISFHINADAVRLYRLPEWQLCCRTAKYSTSIFSNTKLPQEKIAICSIQFLNISKNPAAREVSRTILVRREQKTRQRIRVAGFSGYARGAEDSLLASASCRRGMATLGGRLAATAHRHGGRLGLRLDGRQDRWPHF